jgi:hypothetical protein
MDQERIAMLEARVAMLEARMAAAEQSKPLQLADIRMPPHQPFTTGTPPPPGYITCVKL